MSFYIKDGTEPKVGCCRCGQDTERIFMGKKYCWYCWCDVKDELEDREEPEMVEF